MGGLSTFVLVANDLAFKAHLLNQDCKSERFLRGGGVDIEVQGSSLLIGINKFNVTVTHFILPGSYLRIDERIQGYIRPSFSHGFSILLKVNCSIMPSQAWPVLHWSFQGERILFPFIELGSSTDFIIASLMIILICVSERYVMQSLISAALISPDL